MREIDVRLDGANAGLKTDHHGKRVLEWRRVAGRAMLATSILLVVAGLAGPHARASSKNDREAGADLFKQNGCEHCHGADGVGTDKGPSLTTVGKRLHKDQIERQIQDGGKQMPAFKDVLSDDQTRELVEYLAHKKKAPKVPTGG